MYQSFNERFHNPNFDAKFQKKLKQSKKCIKFQNNMFLAKGEYGN
jgi:hypothetical protein